MSLAEISGPQGPVPQRELCYPLECFIVPQITPVERGKNSMANIEHAMGKMTAASVQKFHVAGFTNATHPLVMISASGDVL